MVELMDSERSKLIANHSRDAVIRGLLGGRVRRGWGVDVKRLCTLLGELRLWSCGPACRSATAGDCACWLCNGV
jgi:hypothetical protein